MKQTHTKLTILCYYHPPTVRHDRIDKLRGQNAPCSPDEWEQILSFLLLGQGSFDNIDATATVKEEAMLTITVRKRVQNITVRFHPICAPSLYYF